MGEMQARAQTQGVGWGGGGADQWGRRRSAQGEGSLMGAAALTQGPGMSTQTAGGGGVDAVGRGRGVDAKAAAQGGSAAQWDGAQTQAGRRQGTRWGPQNPSGRGSKPIRSRLVALAAWKKKKNPHPLASEI